MPLINIVIALIIVGVALWMINRFIPMASSIKTILNGGRGRRLCVGFAGNRTVGTLVQLQGLALGPA